MLDESLKDEKYKIFKSGEIVDRPQVQTTIDLAGQRKKGVFILEGDRGSGKTTMLLSLYNKYLHDNTTRPFLIGLFPYEAPEFARNKNIWLSSTTKLTVSDIQKLLEKITTYLGIKFISTLEAETQREYLSKQLAQRREGNRPVILVDSIYECEDAIRRQIETDILTPLLSSNEVTIILSGRGRRPIWTTPEMRNAQIIKITEFDEPAIKSQLKKINSQHLDQLDTIVAWSGGCPLIVRILGQAENISKVVFGRAIDILIKDALREEYQPEYVDIRKLIEKLALLNETFRELDVVYYLFGDREGGRSATAQLVKKLLESNLLVWDDSGVRRGIRLNKTVTQATLIWVKEQENLFETYKDEWRRAVDYLKSVYPNLKGDEYLKMV